MRDQHRHVGRSGGKLTSLGIYLIGSNWSVLYLRRIRYYPCFSAGTRVSISGWKREENSVYFRSIS